VTSERS